MNPLLKKLNYAAQLHLTVLNVPAGFLPVLDEWQPLTDIRRGLEPGASFVLAFCTQQAEVDALAAQVSAQMPGDAVVWVAYPKGTSRRYKCDFNRDSGWQAFGAAGFEPVRQVAIDADWSALRLRRTEYIRTLKRGAAISEAGKQRIAGRD